MMKIKRAIISVSDKTGIVDFARGLSLLGVELISTGGTHKLLKANGLEVKEVSDLTGFPEMLDGRVKTLHPNIHAGILARRDLSEHMQAIGDKRIAPVDMVVVNLYPFKQTVLKDDTTLDEILDNIDIGGPTMIRAAAKNYKAVAVLTDPDQYSFVLEKLRTDGGLEESYMRSLMAEAFVSTANYDAMIAQYMSRRFLDKLPKSYPIPTEKVVDFEYDPESGRRSAFYMEPFAPGVTVAGSDLLHGSKLTYENIMDLDKALDLVANFDRPTAAVIENRHPSGIASADTILEAYRTAYRIDPEAETLNCTVCLNRTCDMATAEMMSKHAVKVLICPGYEAGVVDFLKSLDGMRILQTNTPIELSGRERTYRLKKIKGGMLIQKYETLPHEEDPEHPANLKSAENI